MREQWKKFVLFEWEKLKKRIKYFSSNLEVQYEKGEGKTKNVADSSVPLCLGLTLLHYTKIRKYPHKLLQKGCQIILFVERDFAQKHYLRRWPPWATENKPRVASYHQRHQPPRVVVDLC